MIRNCSSNGQVLSVSTVKEYERMQKEIGRQFWLYLPLKVFRSSDSLFAVFCCPQCESMAGTESLSLDQDPVQIAARLCIHSKVCSTIIDNWEEVWNVEISSEDNLVNVICNEDITMHTFQEATKESSLLAAVKTPVGLAVL